MDILFYCRKLRPVVHIHKQMSLYHSLLLWGCESIRVWSIQKNKATVNQIYIWVNGTVTGSNTWRSWDSFVLLYGLKLCFWCIIQQRIQVMLLKSTWVYERCACLVCVFMYACRYSFLTLPSNKAFQNKPVHQCMSVKSQPWVHQLGP